MGRAFELGGGSGKGGWREVPDAAARDAIPQNQRSSGMVVVTQDDDIAWQLADDLTSWVPLSFGGGAGDLNWTGEWSSMVSYSAGDGVRYGSDSYISLTSANLGNNPSTSPSDWSLFAMGGSSDAYAVSYTTALYPSIDNVGEALDRIFYVAVGVTFFSGGSVHEIGESVASVALTWGYNKDVTSQSISNGIGSLDPEDRAVTAFGPFTTNQTWALTASDGTTNTGASTSLSFARKRYWGASANESLTASQIRALNQEFASNNDKAVTYDCSGGKYPFFCYPTSFGVLSAVTVGGLAFSDFSQNVISFQNASGHTENYYVTRFNGIQTGAAIAVVWS